MRSIMGNIHQGQVASAGAGMQCTIIALTAIACGLLSQSMYFPSIESWSARDVDRVVLHGSNLYDQYIDNGVPRLLGHNEVPECFQLFDTTVQSTVIHDLYYGVVGQNSNLQTLSTNLRQAFDEAVSVANAFLFTARGMTISILIHHDHVFVFDSHARDRNGLPDEHGTAVVLEFICLDEAVQYLMQIFWNEIYNLSPVLIKIVENCTVSLNPHTGNQTNIVHPDKENFSTENNVSYTQPFCAEDSHKMDFKNNTSLNDQYLDGLVWDGLPFIATKIPKFECTVDDHDYHIVNNCSFENNDDMLLHSVPDACIVNDFGLKSFIHDHTYACRSGKKRGNRKRKYDKKYVHVSVEESFDFLTNTDVDVTSEWLNVASFVDVGTTEPDNFDTREEESSCYIKTDGFQTNKEFELSIRQKPFNYCESCDRFLFENQIHHVVENHLNPVTEKLQLTSNSVLCKTCSDQLKLTKVPKLCSKLNMLEVKEGPIELLNLSCLEKKLLAKIQICMSMVILPGGQFAEKGLVVNLPLNISHITSGLSVLDNLRNMCFVKFEAGTAIGLTGVLCIDPMKMFCALKWLQQNNCLYNDVNISSVSNIHFGPHSYIGVHNCKITPEDETLSSLDEVTLAQVDYTASCDESSDAPRSETITIPHNSAPPVNIYEIPHGEEMAFPWLFPNGNHGYFHPRDNHVPISSYFRYRLYNRHGFWRRNLTYLLHAAVSSDVMALKSQINICMKVQKFSSNTQTQFTTANDVRSRHTDPDVIKNSYMFMKNIRGTVAYFRNALYNLLAMFRYLGPPTLFMTLSADDIHWPELGMMLDNLTYDQAFKAGSFSKSMKADPLLTAIHFERRFTALMKYIIDHPEKPLGHIKDHFVRVEFQNRGSPHYHIFFWVADIPNEISQSSQDVLLDYIKSTVWTHIPSKDTDTLLHNLVIKLQSHSHSKYCMPLNKPPCRFGFPKRECLCTRLLDKIMARQNKGRFYETYRPKDSLCINAYNPHILKHWRANMDIQVVNNAEGAAYYVCHYLCKSEPDELRCALSNLITNVFQQNPSMPVYQRLWNIGICVLKHRRLSAQEASFRLSNLKLLQSSRNVVYVNCRPPNERFKMLRPLYEIKELSSNSTDIFVSNIIDYYHNRPVNFEICSLHYFASWYIRCPEPKGDKHRKNFQERLYIPSYNVWLRKRTKACVLRYPTYSVSSDNYYYSLLMLLLPHRNEQELLQGFESARDSFVAKHAYLNVTVQSHFSFVEQVENCIRRIRQAEDELNALPAECCQKNETQNNTCAVEQCNFDIPSHSPINIHCNESFSDETCDSYFHEMNSFMSASDFETLTKKLTSCQKQVLSRVKSHFINKSNQPLRLFITGGAGVGKSFLLRMLASYLHFHTFILPGTKPVKCCAPTGTAARNIHGQTIHSLLKIPVDKYLTYVRLAAYSLKQVRQAFCGVHTIIIDEISMVSSQLFTYISRRLCEISGIDQPFGGFNILLFGDFFQLRPVRGAFIFKNLILWELFTPFFLRENIRQQGDQQYLQLLNRARVGLLNSANITFLKQHLCKSNLVLSSLSLYATRSAVVEHNRRCQTLLSSIVHTIDAEHYFSQHDQQPGLQCPNEYIPEDDRDAGNLPRILSISQNSRVMLIRNIDVAIGLVNGAIGTVKQVECTEVGNVIRVSVLFDDKTIGINSSHNLPSDSAESLIHIERCEHTFIYNGRSIVRRAFPLVLCWSCTIHKVQGLTLQSCSIDLGSSIFQPGMGYVALSRITSGSGLRLAAFSPNSIQADDEVLEEYERLRNKYLP